MKGEEEERKREKSKCEQCICEFAITRKALFESITKPSIEDFLKLELIFFIMLK